MIQQNINIEMAREKLGSRADKMKDKDIQEVLNSLYFLCEQVLQGHAVDRKEIHAN